MWLEIKNIQELKIAFLYRLPKLESHYKAHEVSIQCFEKGKVA